MGVSSLYVRARDAGARVARSKLAAFTFVPTHSQFAPMGRVTNFEECCLPTARWLPTLGVRHLLWQLDPSLGVLFDDRKMHGPVQTNATALQQIAVGKLSKWVIRYRCV